MTQTQSDTAKRFVIDKFEEDAQASRYCQEFLTAKPENCYVSGRIDCTKKDCAKSIVDLVDVGFFIDDFTEETDYLVSRL